MREVFTNSREIPIFRYCFDVPTCKPLVSHIMLLSMLFSNIDGRDVVKRSSRPILEMIKSERLSDDQFKKVLNLNKNLAKNEVNKLKSMVFYTDTIK